VQLGGQCDHNLAMPVYLLLLIEFTSFYFPYCCLYIVLSLWTFNHCLSWEEKNPQNSGKSGIDLSHTQGRKETAKYQKQRQASIDLGIVEKWSNRGCYMFPGLSKRLTLITSA